MRWLLAAATAATVLTGVPALAGGGTTSAEVPDRRPVSATIIRTSTVDAPVQVNVDIGMQVRAGRRCTATLPGVCKGVVYHPCFNLDDPAYKACQLYTLFRVVHAGTAVDLAQGIAVGNAGRARDGSTVLHNWASKITQADLELYSADPQGRYGDVRLRVPAFPHVVGTNAYSDAIGHIPLPREGAADTGRLVGRAVGKDGRPMAPGSFKLDTFGHGDTGHRTGVLQDRVFTVYGFGGAKVKKGVTDGSFASKPLWAGS